MAIFNGFVYGALDGGSDDENIVSSYSNSNLLIDWYFANPVNRKGKTEYAGAGFSIDMWQSMYGGGDCRVSIFEPGTKNGCLKLYRPANNGHLNQILPGYVALLRGKTVTFSILAKTDLADKGGARLFIRTPNETFTNPWTYLSTDTYSIAQATVTIPEESASNDLMVDVTCEDGSTLSIIAAKLELGTVQTLAHKEGDTWVLNEIPNYAEQYVICSQYDPTTGEFIGNKSDSTEVYSDQETEIGTYFGEKLYQKTFKFTISTLNQSTQILPSQTYIKEVVDIIALLTTSENAKIKLPFLDGDFGYIMVYADGNNAFNYFSSTSRGYGNGVCTIKYTKN